MDIHTQKIVTNQDVHWLKKLYCGYKNQSSVTIKQEYKSDKSNNKNETDPPNK